MATIGIDLGTTFCCIAAHKTENAETIQNEIGCKTTPSYVAFTETELLAGQGAKNQAFRNAKNTIYNVKRIIGRSSEDPFLQSCIENLPFDTVNCKGKLKINVQFEGVTKQYFPEEIYAILLNKLKLDAEKYLNKPVKDVVITVPAAFNNNQRQCTIDAAKIAGLNVLRLLNEPTAAAIAYGLDQKCPDGHNILVYDLGGGTFDVSILRKQGSEFTVLTSVGDPKLGGEDFDSLLLDHCIAAFELRNANCNLSHTVSEFTRVDKADRKGKAISRLRKECEFAKRCLSSANNYKIEVDNLYEGIDFEYEISRSRFEEMCRPLFDRTIEILKTALSDAQLDTSQIYAVVMSGGSTRIPCINAMVKGFFGGMEIQTNVNADEIVAQGAAIWAKKFFTHNYEGWYELVLIEKTSHSLGIRKQGGLMEVLIQRNTRYPCSVTKTVSTSRDNQKEVWVEVYEGENSLVEKNKHLGTFTISGIPPSPKSEIEIEITLDIDADGVLRVSRKLPYPGKPDSIVIKRDHLVLTDEEISRKSAEFAERLQAEETAKKRKAAKTSLENFAYEIRSNINSTNKQKELGTEILAWLEENQDKCEAEYLQKLSLSKISYSAKD